MLSDKQRAALIQAAEAWDRWEQLERDQDAWRKRNNGELASWPRDCYESWIDDLVTNAKEALKSE